MARDVVIVERDEKEVRICVEKWRQQATPNEPRNDVSVNIQSSPLSSVPLTPKSLSSDTDFGPLLPGLPTPPVSENAATRSPSLTLLDERTTTDYILEQIKSDAFARAQQLQDSPPLQFDELPDSSSDEEDLSFTISTSPKGKSRSVCLQQILQRNADSCLKKFRSQDNDPRLIKISWRSRILPEES